MNLWRILGSLGMAAVIWFLFGPVWDLNGYIIELVFKQDVTTILGPSLLYRVLYTGMTFIAAYFELFKHWRGLQFGVPQGVA